MMRITGKPKQLKLTMNILSETTDCFKGMGERAHVLAHFRTNFAEGVVYTICNLQLHFFH